ncbi:DUF779 domain-containing protein [Caldibacillus debilis]|uniref:DUF779 domain-containing protein n=1 Tax=Caldibacillus debilis TaxID=301148 RepID=UPI0003707AAB
MIMDRVKRVLVTDEAKKVIDRLREKHGELMFFQSGGCCDGSAPMCYKRGTFRIGSSDVKLGEIHGCPFYISGPQFEYWKHTQLTVDVTEGRGASFSLEIPLGVRFLIRSRPFTRDEATRLEPIKIGEE